MRIKMQIQDADKGGKQHDCYQSCLLYTSYTEVFGLAVRMSPDGTRIDVTVPSP